MKTRSARGVIPRAKRAAEQGVGALLRLDERLVNRVDPPIEAPLDTSRYPWTGAIESAWPTVRGELDAALDAGLRLPETSDLVGVDQGAEGRWTTYVMHWYGRWLDDNCARMPRTAALLASIPGLQIAGFTVLEPHTHLPRHQGPAKSLRWQMGVRVPEPAGSCRLRVGDTTVVWTEGSSLAFDDRAHHEAWNDSDETRYVLFVQVAWPISGPVGAVHRLTHRVLGGATRRIPRRAEELDRALNAR